MKELSPLERAIEYIETHLDEPIGLSDVSRETGYSYYYMTRLFSSVLGEPVGRYISRRRLYKASEKLLYTDRRVIDIALESGFESSEAFSRAFKAVFGSSPVEYRRAGIDLVMNARRKLEPGDVCHIANNISREPEIIQMEETKAAGIRGTTSLFDNRLPKLWEQFLALEKNNPGSEGIRYCICETQQTSYTKNGDVLFSVMVGSQTADYHNLTPGLAVKTLHAGKYAVFTHRGDYANLYKTYQYIFGIWLPSAKEELDGREDFEQYEGEVISPDDPDNEVKIYIPIK